MLTDMVQSKPWQLEAEIQSVDPGEGSPGASLATQCGVHAATITAHCKTNTGAIFTFHHFYKSNNPLQISFG